MSLFARLDKAAQAMQEAVFGELFAHLPRKRQGDVNAPAQADGGRLEATLVGIYREIPVTDTNVVDAWDQRADRRPGVTASRHVIEIDPRRYPGLEIRQSDTLTRAADGVAWRVVAVDPDDMGRLHMAVERVG